MDTLLVLLGCLLIITFGGFCFTFMAYGSRYRTLQGLRYNNRVFWNTIEAMAYEIQHMQEEYNGKGEHINKILSEFQREAEVRSPWPDLTSEHYWMGFSLGLFVMYMLMMFFFMP